MATNTRVRVPAIGATCALLAGLFVGSGCTKSEEKPHEPAFLLVQSSRGFEYDGIRRMTVLGTSPSTVFFSDRPDRIAGHMPLEKAYEWGRTGDDNFIDNPPNATVSFLEKGEVANVVVTMSNATIQGDSISFDVDILEGELPLRGGPNTIFIDVIGAPLTPLSVAGVRRRTRRRSLAVGYAVGASHADSQSTAASQSAAASASEAAAAASEAAAAAGQAAYAAQNAADAANTAGSPTLEQKLSELKHMLDQGLITQQDYEAKKKQLLEGM